MSTTWTDPRTGAVLGPYGRVIVQGTDPGVWNVGASNHREVLESVIAAYKAQLVRWVAEREAIERASSATGNVRVNLKVTRKRGRRKRQDRIDALQAQLDRHMEGLAYWRSRASTTTEGTTEGTTETMERYA